MEPIEIGKQIKALREAAGLTQLQLSHKADVSLSNLTQIEQGLKWNLKLSTLLSLSRALGTTIDGLLPLPETPAAEEKKKRPRRT